MKDQSTKTETADIVPAGASAIEKPVTYSFDQDVQRVVAMRKAVEDIVTKVLRENEHYGVIPGTQQAGKKPKKALLQPGAEVLCQVFRLRPEYTVETREERPDFIMREVRCRLYNSVTGELVGEAIGSANSREEKYLAQTAARICPACGKPTIIKGKDEYGGGWLCFPKKGGCGAKYGDEDKKILDQIGQVSGDKVMNLHHTIISIAQKRAYVKAVRNATATSDIFTDEPEDAGDMEAGHRPTEPAHTTTAPKAEPVKYADAIVLRDLSWAIRDSKMCEVPKDTDPAKKDDLYRARRLAWINWALASIGQKEVEDATKITEAQAKILTEMAKRGEKPEGVA